MLTAAYQQRARVPLFVPKMAPYLSACLGRDLGGRDLRAGTHGLEKRRGDRASSLVLSALSRRSVFAFVREAAWSLSVEGLMVVHRVKRPVRLSDPPWNCGFTEPLRPWHSSAAVPAGGTHGSGPCDGRTGDGSTEIPALFLILLRGFGVVRTFWAK